METSELVREPEAACRESPGSTKKAAQKTAIKRKSPIRFLTTQVKLLSLPFLSCQKDIILPLSGVCARQRRMPASAGFYAAVLDIVTVTVLMTTSVICPTVGEPSSPTVKVAGVGSCPTSHLVTSVDSTASAPPLNLTEISP